MTIEYIQKDLTTISYGIVAHGCNTKGKMGAGVALAIRKKYPEVYKEYLKIMPNDNLLGTVQFVQINESLIIANCLTQKNYGRNGIYADLNAIDKCFNTLSEYSWSLSLPIYTTKIGCGLGGLKWENVEPIIKKYANIGTQIYICEIIRR